jgi:hypothetical protein
MTSSLTDTPIVDLASAGGPVSNDEKDKPPKRGVGRPKGSLSGARTTGPKKQTPLPPWKDGVIASWATNLYTTAGRMVAAFDPNYGTVLQGIAEPAGQAWENLAKNSPQMRRVFHHLMTTTKLSELIMAHIPLFILVLHKHGPVKNQFEKFADKFAGEMAETMASANGHNPEPDGFIVDDE